MRGAVFFETLRRSWRGMLWWGIGLGLTAFINILAVPNVESIQQIADLMETMPPIFMQMLGGSDASFFATPEGYLALQVFSFFPLLLGIYGAITGMNIIANEEERNITDLLLSLPIERWRVILEKSLAYAVLSIGVVVIIYAWIAGSLALVPEVSAQMDMGEVGLATLGMIPLTWVVMAFAALVTGLLRRRGLAVALVAVFIVGSYFLNSLGMAAPGTILHTLQPLSYFAHLNAQSIMQGAAEWGGLVGVTIASVLFVAGGMFFFQRRDVGA